MKKKKSMIILIVYLIVAFVGVTFAWIDESAVPTGQSVILQFGRDSVKERTLGIVAINVSFELQVLDEATNEYVTTNDLTECISKTGIVPNQPVYLKILLGNPTDETQYIDFQLAKMSCAKPEIFDYLYFSVNSVTNYPEGASTPVGIYTCFSEDLKQSGNFYSSYIATDVSVPPTSEDIPVELYCYILFSRLIDSSYEDLQLDIGIFRVLL